MMSVPWSQSCLEIIFDFLSFLDAEIRLQMEPKIQESKNPSFQIESLDSGQKDWFLMIFWFPSFF